MTQIFKKILTILPYFGQNFVILTRFGIIFYFHQLFEFSPSVAVLVFSFQKNPLLVVKVPWYL
jgi:hypothetical protein